MNSVMRISLITVTWKYLCRGNCIFLHWTHSFSENPTEEDNYNVEKEMSLCHEIPQQRLMLHFTKE